MPFLDHSHMTLPLPLMQRLLSTVGEPHCQLAPQSTKISAEAEGVLENRGLALPRTDVYVVIDCTATVLVAWNVCVP